MKPTPKPAGRPAGRHILYVEDHDDSRTLLSLVLRQAGYDVTAVESVAAAQELSKPGRYGLYILDNWLNDGSGVALCEHLRASDPGVPILLYSGDGFDTAKEAALAAGASAYLTKPVEIADFTATVAHLLGTP